MAVLLALATFILFCTLDFIVHRLRAAKTVAAPQTAAVPAPVPELAEEPLWVAGYELPERLYYHPGHMWARVVSPDTVVVGMDDFARRLTGPATGVRLPAVGAWLRQGAKAVGLEADGKRTDMLAPVEGEVVDVNREIRREPTVLTEDPYGRGWLFKLRSGNLAANLRNLMSGSLARRWTEDAREQLTCRLMALSGSVMADGGEPARDFALHLDPADWRDLTTRFFLTGTPDGQGDIR
ncbi:MAG: glycine cleavage system protein H [Planctomycetes bacterium]|nr:glycine cleavage system protein H [Planctomycetota bacterium]